MLLPKKVEIYSKLFPLTSPQNISRSKNIPSYCAVGPYDVFVFLNRPFGPSIKGKNVQENIFPVFGKEMDLKKASTLF